LLLKTVKGMASVDRDATDDSRFMALTSLSWWPVLVAPWLAFAVLVVWLGWRRVLLGAVLLEGLALISVSLLNTRTTRRRRLRDRLPDSPAAEGMRLPLANRG
jgi:hypothetical protein